MERKYILGKLIGEASCGDDYTRMYPVALVENPEHPVNVKICQNEILLMGPVEEFFHDYRHRRVQIATDTLFFPNEDYGITASKDYHFPDSHQDISALLPSLEKMLANMNVMSRRNIFEECGEDYFFAGIGKQHLHEGTAFLLTMKSYEPQEKMDMLKWSNIPYTKLASLIKPHGPFLKSERYLCYRGLKFSMCYDEYFIKKGNEEQFRKLANANNNLTQIDDTLAQAFSDPRYMEALCKATENILTQSCLNLPNRPY